MCTYARRIHERLRKAVVAKEREGPGRVRNRHSHDKSADETSSGCEQTTYLREGGVIVHKSLLRIYGSDKNEVVFI